MNVYLCALCDGRGPLLRLKPSKWYACQDCVRKHGSRDHALLEIVQRLKVMAAAGDQRLNNPSVLAAIQSMSKELQLRARVVA